MHASSSESMIAKPSSGLDAVHTVRGYPRSGFRCRHRLSTPELNSYRTRPRYNKQMSTTLAFSQRCPWSPEAGKGPWSHERK